MIVTLENIKDEARQSYSTLWAKARSLGRDVKIY